MTLGDEKYIEHMKAFAVNCRLQGEWKDDICFVLAPDAHHKKDYFLARGIHTILAERPSYYAKYSMFDHTCHSWDRVFYSDSDCMVQRPVQPLFDLDLNGKLIADVEPWPVKQLITSWKESVLTEHKSVADYYWSLIPPTAPAFGTCNMLWNQKCMGLNRSDALDKIHKIIEPINVHCGNGTDQLVLNAEFYSMFAQVPDRLFSYFEQDSDKTILLHYTSLHQPWDNTKAHGDGAYLNKHLNRPCYEIYCDNLAAFDRVFPVL